MEKQQWCCSASLHLSSKHETCAQDLVWEAAYTQLSALNGQLAKACVQNPLEYRATASSAVAFASRSHDLGVDVEQATEFCTKMMG